MSSCPKITSAAIEREEKAKISTKNMNAIYYNLQHGQTITIMRRESERKKYTKTTGEIVYKNKNIFILSLKNKRESFSRFDLLDGSVVIVENGVKIPQY